MNISHASVHPVEDPRTAEAVDVPRLRMKDFQGMPATFNVFTVRSLLLTFAATSASAGITVFIDNDLRNCSQNHCTQFEAATAIAFASWFVALPSFLFNYWFLVIR